MSGASERTGICSSSAESAVHICEMRLRTSVGWPLALTRGQTSSILPVLLMRKELRTMPMKVRPMNCFFCQAPNFAMVSWVGSRSEERRVGKSVDLGGRRIIKKKKSFIGDTRLSGRASPFCYTQYYSLVIFSPKQAEKQLFFFSSRRRHTRFKCDWSSDVCSSD